MRHEKKMTKSHKRRNQNFEEDLEIKDNLLIQNTMRTKLISFRMQIIKIFILHEHF